MYFQLVLRLSQRPDRKSHSEFTTGYLLLFGELAIPVSISIIFVFCLTIITTASLAFCKCLLGLVLFIILLLF